MYVYAITFPEHEATRYVPYQVIALVEPDYRVSGGVFLRDFGTRISYHDHIWISISPVMLAA
jgi:hypothetical protein